jgi:hypothetical protein
MPQNKDFKSLVRARMAKTGEGYSVARMHLLKQVREQPGMSSATARIGAAPSRGDDVRPGAIYQLRLSLKGISPPIWRRRAGYLAHPAGRGRLGRPWAHRRPVLNSSHGHLPAQGPALCPARRLGRLAVA